ncbi:lipopolysaccharide biosynthesis protein [Geobacter sp. 60473]|uniref:lipopolysaccharide biosynthesis protein n=1 Tax=Geobacter sp. 60473 TaxID=3080755 RepID=UPI002B2D674A|nr:lipopolysaccharide biosynthesis protein [Geobacter sp. 60473]
MGLGRQIFKHTAIYSAATIVGKLASFLMLPFYAHIFQTKGYGVIGMIDASLGILTVLFTGGFQMAILRIYHEQEDHRKELALGTGVRLVWGLSALTVLLPILFSSPISRIVLGSAEYYPLVCLALVTFVIDVAGQSASTFLIIRQKSLLFSTVGLVRLFLGLSLNIWLVVILQVGLIGVFISSLVSAAVSTLIFHVVALRDHGFGFDRQIAGSLLRFQLPLLPGELVGFLGRQAERVLVRFLIGLEGMGVLEMAYKFAPLLNLLINIPFGRSWRTKSIEIAEQEDAPRVMGEMFTRYLFFMIFVGLVLAVVMQDILELMTPQSFWSAKRIAQVEIVTTILTGCTTFLSFGILYRKETKIFTYVKSVLTPIKIALAFTLISLWGLSGAAYSALIIEAATLVWIFHRSQGLYRIPLEYRRIGVMVGGAAIIFALLDGNRYEHFGPAVYAREYLLPGLTGFLQGTPLGEWKSGKLIHLFRMKEGLVVSLFFNMLASMMFLAVIPLLRGKKLLPGQHEVNNA